MGIPIPCLTYLYENTLEGSKLRSLIVDLASESFDFANIEETPELFPKDFLIAVIAGWRALQQAPGDVKAKFLCKKVTKLCRYHDHAKPRARSLCSEDSIGSGNSFDNVSDI